MRCRADDCLASLSVGRTRRDEFHKDAVPINKQIRPRGGTCQLYGGSNDQGFEYYHCDDLPFYRRFPVNFRMVDHFHKSVQFW